MVSGGSIFSDYKESAYHRQPNAAARTSAAHTAPGHTAAHTAAGEPLACIAYKSLEICKRCRLWQRNSPAAPKKFYYPCGGQAEFAASLANSGLAPRRLTTRLIWRKLLVISCAFMTRELTPKLKLTRWWMLVAAVVLLVVLVSAGWFIFQDQRRRVYLRNGREALARSAVADALFFSEKAVKADP